MKELIKSKLMRKAALGATIATGMTLSSSCVLYQEPDQLPPPPDGFSRNIGDYTWKIQAKESVLFGEGEVVLFSNIPPEVKEGATTVLNAYCPIGDQKYPNFQKKYRESAGCTNEFMTIWLTTGSATVSDNQGIK